jgi:autotransporter-associated beta strand protein
MTLSGSSSYSGNTALAAGTLALGNASALGSGTLVLTGNATVRASAPVLNVVNNVSLGSFTGTVDTQGNALTLSGTIRSTGGGLTKVGSGTLTLTAAETYSGSTAVAAGTLMLNGAGSISNSPVVDVQSGATLDVSTQTVAALGSGQTLEGNGRVNGSVTLNGGVTPGEGGAVGTLTFNNALTLGSTATVTMGLVNTSSFSQIVAQGAMSYGGTMTLSVTPGTLANSTQYQLYVLNGGFSGDFGNVYLNGSGAAFTDNAGTWTYTDSANNQLYTFTDGSGLLQVTAAVPEPAVWALLGLGAVAVFAGRYLRRRKLPN